MGLETQDYFIALNNSELCEQQQDDVDIIKRIKVSLRRVREILTE